MSKPIVNVVVGDVTTQREMTDEEYAQWLVDAEFEYDGKILAIRQERAAAKEAAEAKLAALGLTGDDLKALGF